MENEILTVFTPTFNRSQTLRRTYEWMRRQSCKKFVWLIIDDGSTDDTKDQVRQWQKAPDNGFKLSYVWKENGGLHTGYNKAIELANTELIVCVDSDDYMPEDAVESIISFWEKHKAPQYAGFIGLDYKTDGSPTGGNLPNVPYTTLTDLRQKYHYVGDTKVVMRTDLLKKYIPQPTFCGEKNFNPIYIMLHLDFEYTFLLYNKNLCYVDYQVDGMTANTYNQYVNSPNSFAALRVLMISIPNTKLTYKLRQYIHLGASAALARNLSWLKKSQCPLLAFVSFPLGFLLSLYIKYKIWKK